MPRIRLLDLGLMDFGSVYELQKKIVAQKKQDLSADYLILVEHPAVYTFGRKSVIDSSLPNSFQIERGGMTTFHNPGQLVCYPILQLKEHERNVPWFIRSLEKTLIALVKDFGLDGIQVAGATGVWLRESLRKIASIGVALSRWITYHGCALNVCNDMDGFSKINPCGLSSQVMTSMKYELGNLCPNMEQIKMNFVRHFCCYFNRAL